MKARVKATGEIVEISEDCSYVYAEHFDKSFNINELEFLDVKEKSFPKDEDYCDYDTCVALWSMGLIPHPYDNTDTDKVMAIISLYGAQKWLREEKKLIVLVGFDFCPITSEIVYNWVIVVNGNTAKKSSYTYDYFEESLSEGIKEAVKILKKED